MLDLSWWPWLAFNAFVLLLLALDLGVFHGINPADGTTVVAMTDVLSTTTNSVTVGSKAYTALRSPSGTWSSTSTFASFR